MSISGALNNAMSGLRAAGRSSQVVTNNIANALTPGYAPRSLELSSPQLVGSGGVKVVGVVRHSDPQLLSDRRQAAAEQGYRSAEADFHDRFETILGTPDQTGSLSGRFSTFENSLISASSRPDAIERLTLVLTSAQDLASGLNNASLALQEMRSDADRSITVQVERLNNALGEIATLNGDIAAHGQAGRDVSSLLDQRQALIDEVSGMVPVRLMERSNGAVALYSMGGALLLDGAPSEIEFTATPLVTPYMSLGAGTLSGLTVNGLSIDVSSDRGMMRGGTLGAQFAIRDELAPESQTQLDAIARDLIERFEDPAVDPTLGATDPGLFTDVGAAFDPLAEVGLAERISVNALVDPDQGGEVWRLRDGLGAATPGDPGNATLINAVADTLSDRRTPASGNFGVGLFSALELTSSLQSQVGADRLVADQRLTFASTQLTELQLTELEQGVDTDAELQRMLLIEQAYAANARMIQAADEMMQALLGI